MALLALLTAASLLSASPADTTLAFGAKLPKSAPLALATVAAAPARYTGKPIVVEGVISAVCQEQGCWMQITPDTTKGALAVKVDFSHKFFIPMNSSGMKAKVLGTATVKNYTREEAAHLIDEGGKLKLNADGTATGLDFVATGVELNGRLGPPVKMSGMKHEG